MKTHEIKLEQPVVTFIERLNYEYETLKDNVAYMVQHFGGDENFLESTLFRKYQDRQIQAKINFERGMSEVYEKFVPEALKEHRIDWKIDFRQCMLIVNQYCNCEVYYEEEI